MNEAVGLWVVHVIDIVDAATAEMPCDGENRLAHALDDDWCRLFHATPVCG